MKKRWIVLLGLLLLIVCVYAKGIRVKPFPADLDKATTMILQSGNTGTRITITDPEEIQNVRDMMEKRFYLPKEFRREVAGRIVSFLKPKTRKFCLTSR